MRKTVSLNKDTHELLRKASFGERQPISTLIAKAVEKVYAKYL